MVVGVLKLKPYFVEKIWGWEKWVLSCNNEGNSIVENGNEQGKNLSEVLLCGNNFPVLTKIIKANETLSIQVHPDDSYAKIHENSRGKTECWYIIDAEEDATLIIGIKNGVNRENLKSFMVEGKIVDCLERIPVKAGDFIYIPAGTVHAIEGGIKLIEVQQNSNITYRLFDWNRGRDTHIEKSLDVIDYGRKNEGGKIKNFSKLETPYFSVEKIDVKFVYEDVVKEDFHSYTVINGEGIVRLNNKQIKLYKEETIYIPNGITYKIEGDIALIKVIV